MNGQMAESLKENGKTIKWKDMEFSHGQMEEDMRVSISMIRKKVKECSFGQMVENMMVIGKMENSMELVFIHQQLAKLRKENGMKEKESHGSTE